MKSYTIDCTRVEIIPRQRPVCNLAKRPSKVNVCYHKSKFCLCFLSVGARNLAETREVTVEVFLKI